MGVDRRPLLPAPTESVLDTTATPTDLATDLSRRTDRTSYSIPEDGSPVTISTSSRRRRPSAAHRDSADRISRHHHHHHSQTSLLIEYFEGSKKASSSASGAAVSARPSVRVRVTPSASRRKDRDTIHISDGGRKPSYTRRISLSTPRSSAERERDRAGADDRSLSSDGDPVEIEISRGGSELSRYLPTSDISSMPADSTLDRPLVTSETSRRRSQSVDSEEDELEHEHEHEQDDTLLKTPARQRSRSLSRERIAQKAAEKVAAAPRDAKSGSRVRSGKQRERERDRDRDRDLASPGSSYLSASLASGTGKPGSGGAGGDAYSFRSGTSRSSLNNPRLLETVEDAIRRLILPELKELKKDSSVKNLSFSRDKDRTLSKEDLSRSKRSLSKEDISSPKTKGRSLSKEDIHSPSPKSKGRSLSKEDIYSPSPKSKGLSKEDVEERRPSISSRRGSKDHIQDPSSVSRKRSKGLRDAEAARIVGTALTTAALRHHDSSSSLGKARRASEDRLPPKGTDTELIFQKHDVAPMPFRSGIDSDMTRQSILSQPSVFTATALEGEVPRGSLDQRQHDHHHDHDHDHEDDHEDQHMYDGQKYDADYDGKLHPIDEDHEPSSETRRLIDSPNLHPYDQDHDQHQYIDTNINTTNTRALSPIQSVASYGLKDTNAASYGHKDTNADRALTPAYDPKAQRLSIESLSSAASTDLARSTRTADYSHDKRHPPTIPDEESGAELDIGTAHSPGYWDRHHEDDRETKRTHTTYTDDTFTDPLDQGQQVAGGRENSVEYVQVPVGVESAVASLLDPSVLSSNVLVNRSSRSYTPGIEDADLHEHGGLLEDDHLDDHLGDDHLEERDLHEDHEDHHEDHDVQERGLDLEGETYHDERPFHERMGMSSPPHSAQFDADEHDRGLDHDLDHEALAEDHADLEGEDLEEEHEEPLLGATALPTAGSPIPEIGHGVDSESDINTNPSIIQGPIGGISHESRDHWPYQASPPRDRDLQTDDMHHLGPEYGAALGVITEEPHDDGHDILYGMGIDKAHFDMPSPGPKDEGYISGANHRSNSSATPEPKGKGYDVAGLGSPMDLDDPFSDKHKRHLSGHSHGMPPLYDSSTGRGIERIQSKDIVALMDHLTVRDAQRNARDTEILITLVRSAAEMRTSFEDMKKYIAQQDELLLDANTKGHDRTHKAVGGPRPIPMPRAHSKMSSDFEEELRSKKKNVFKRALKTLSLKSSGDLTNIEEMLLHLLTEVEALRAAQEGRTPGSAAANNDAGNGYDEQSPEQQSPYANSPHRTNDRLHSSQRGISPVLEVNEEEPLTRDEQAILENPSPPGSRFAGRHKRGASVPLATPERVPVASNPPSADTTPKMSNEKSRKSKSSSSSFFPKISRWSRTTASSMGENIRNSIQPRKDRFSSEASRSNSDLDNANYTTAEYYDHRGDDRLRSNTSVNKDGNEPENRPPSPLVPSQLSEIPKYRAHRDSLNLQHPQPRQGPTSRYQNQLESQAQHFGAPHSPGSDAWASNPTLAIARDRPSSAAENHRPMSAGAYSVSSSVMSGPARPPKIRDDGPLIPQRSSKLSEDFNPSYAERMAMREGTARMVDHVLKNNTNGSPSRSSPGRGVPQRKPTGPRPLTSSGKGAGTMGPQRPQHDYDDY